MEFSYSPKVKEWQQKLNVFMDEHVYPNEQIHREQIEASRWEQPPIVEQLKARAKHAGLWNLFLPDSKRGGGLTNLEYAPLCEIMGRSAMAAEVFNCAAPDTGNMRCSTATAAR